ncbi:xanthine dehydrogenase family protein molybdopterin-binding subunit [Aliigemmobacter aestuarii]|uniref:Xanthine dehydrogenase family protein molybdopterin-binding subunit n=1 Tax=Aliigemmobacter aestuarii TaxID=1445661 RepID=A0A4S3MTF2_9RHOB|nr:xanthine dehydrogenase family protein molybdopterin-binding subunit [Gemmobacter aestuarii]THD85797.1 xanthine dehydrogenase family protein molybdopterin-binding subunit [Gemmobacter aestuarii]
MQKFGQAQGRIEDRRFLTGQGRYIDDIAPEGALHAVFLRSPVAHATIDRIDVSAARMAAGVHEVLWAGAPGMVGVTPGMKGARVPNRDGTRGAAPERPVLARGALRFVGEPVVCIIAETRDQALDAMELVELDYTELPVALDLAPGAPEIHATAPNNLAYDFALGDDAAVEAALAASAHRVRVELRHNRIIVNAMEPRGCFAEWDGARLHFAFNGQGVWVQKGELARMLALPPDAVRVTNPDVGGGFGMKAMTYPEYVVVAQAARLLGRPVRWMADRTESMLSDNAGRDLVTVSELGFDADHRITAYRVNLVSNLGAYNSQFGQPIQSELFSKVLTGVYDIQTAFLGARGVYTNTCPVDAYRGAGRPEAIFTIERTMDEAARALGVDPFALRLKNVMRDFPYRMVNGTTVDVGDFPRVMNRLRDEAEISDYPARVARSRAAGRLRGMGLAVYIESILGDPAETTRVEFTSDGVNLHVGTQSNGQGHETVFPRMLSERTGIPVDVITLVQGDSDRIATGGGTGGSRSVTVQGTAIWATADAMIDAFTAFLSDELGEPVGFDDGIFGAPGRNLRLTMIEAAELARDRGRDDLLDHSRTITLEARSFPNGAHLAEVEVDPETGKVTLDRYTVTDDFGTLINPQLAIGQVHGGIAQGFGQAVTEAAHYDETGQLLTASFMDYAMPRADDLPMIRFSTEPTPSIYNPLGMKGCGEAGTVAGIAAVANAVRDALATAGVGWIDMPFSPARVWRALKEAGAVVD